MRALFCPSIFPTAHPITHTHRQRIMFHISSQRFSLLRVINESTKNQQRATEFCTLPSPIPRILRRALQRSPAHTHTDTETFPHKSEPDSLEPEIIVCHIYIYIVYTFAAIGRTGAKTKAENGHGASTLRDDGIVGVGVVYIVAVVERDEVVSIPIST